MKEAFIIRNTTGQGAQTATRALQVLELVVDTPQPLSLSELAHISGLQVNAAYRVLSALEDAGMLTRDRGSRRYVVGPKLIAMAAKVTQGLSIRSLALPLMQSLVDETSETVSLHALSGYARVCVAAIEGTHAVRRVIPEGQLQPLFAGPSGKAILAFFEGPELAAILDEAGRAGESVSRISGQLRKARQDGYLALVGDRIPGVGGLSAPVFDSNGVVASLTISGPAERWTKSAMDTAAPLLLEHASELSKSLGAANDGLITRAVDRGKRAKAKL